MSNQRAASRTPRAMQPFTAAIIAYSAFGPRGMRPYAPFMPTSPVYAAGMRIDPPPSPAVAIGTRPPATAAADPPDEPPGVRSRFQGLRVTPCTFVEV